MTFGFLRQIHWRLLEHCPQCGGDFKIVAAIEEPAVIVKVLTRRRAHSRGRCLSSSRPDSQDKSGSATGLTIPHNPCSREAVRLRRREANRADVGADSQRERGIFTNTARLTACRAGDIVANGEKVVPNPYSQLSDLMLYVIDVATAIEPGVTKSDLLVINKIDLAPTVGASSWMDRDAKKTAASGRSSSARRAVTGLPASRIAWGRNTIFNVQ